MLFTQRGRDETPVMPRCLFLGIVESLLAACSHGSNDSDSALQEGTRGKITSTNLWHPVSCRYIAFL